MSSAATIYETCLDSELDISQCVSDAFEAVRKVLHCNRRYIPLTYIPLPSGPC